MKLKSIIISALSVLLFASCYKFDPLPDKISVDNDYAFPVFDSTLKVSGFEFFDDSGTSGTINKGTQINSGERGFPFFMKDFIGKDGANKIGWIEPKMILSDNIAVAGTTLQVSIYTKENGVPFYFWLPENTKVISPGPTTIPTTPQRIDEAVINRLKQCDSIFMNVNLVFATDVSWGQIKDFELKTKLGMKVNFKGKF